MAPGWQRTVHNWVDALQAVHVARDEQVGMVLLHQRLNGRLERRSGAVLIPLGLVRAVHRPVAGHNHPRHVGSVCIGTG